MTVVFSTLSQHAEEAAVLWLRRDRAVGEPHFHLADLAKLDRRVEGNLDGLRIAVQNEPELTWQICDQELQRAEPGEVFSAAILAWESRLEKRIRSVIKAAAASYECSRALVSSLAWLPEELANPHIDRLLGNAKSFHRRIGIAACAVRGRDPGEPLARAVETKDKLLKARALRAVGELARRDLLLAAKEALRARELGVKFAAAWSLARLSDEPKAIEVLKKVVESATVGSPNGAMRDRALQLVLRKIEVKTASKWLKKLARNPSQVRQAVIGSGVVGTPDSIGWLLEMMSRPELARVAGEAVSMITGVDLAGEKLETDRPEDFESGPNDDPADENVAMDDDENLPWPNAPKLAAWWERRRADFEPQTRYLCGKTLTPEWLQDVLRKGYQRQRAAAALELAIRSPDQPLFNVRAPGHRQQELLS